MKHPITAECISPEKPPAKWFPLNCSSSLCLQLTQFAVFNKQREMCFAVGRQQPLGDFKIHLNGGGFFFIDIHREAKFFQNLTWEALTNLKVNTM